MRAAGKHKHWPGHRWGFSLVDLVVTMLIMGLMASVSVPRFGAMLAEYRVDSAATRLAADLKFAQQYARTHGASETVTFDVPGNRYTFSSAKDPDSALNVYSVDLSQHPWQSTLAAVYVVVEVEGAKSRSARNAVTFSGFGFPSEGLVIVLRYGTVARYVTLDAVSGAVNVAGVPL